METTKYINIKFNNIIPQDAPDFVDAFIEYAEHINGTILTDSELEKLNNDRELVYILLTEYLY